MFTKATHLFGKALRETGQALDRLGLVIAENEIFRETFSRHRQVMNIYDKRPILAVDAFIAPNASVIGKVLILDGASVWYGAVVRGDKNRIKIGFKSNVQDRAVLSCVSEVDNGFSSEIDIGNYVTIGHGALLTSCKVGDESLIGQGAIIGAGSIVEGKSIVAAGAVVLPGTYIPTGQLWAGNPAKYIRDITEEESGFEKMACDYSDLAKDHHHEFLPFGTVYQEAEKHIK